MGPAEDVELAIELARGGREALAELYDRHSPAMLGLGLKLLRDRGEAEEILHDVFLEAWKRAGDYDPSRGSVRTWLMLRMRSRCLDRINAYRGSAGVAPLSSNAGKLACVDGQAQKDALAQTAHGAFGQCSEAAQNECPGWSGTPASVVDSCIDMMFKEGPGSGSAHGHYTNMMEPSYRTVACGFYVTSSGAVWITQDFYR